jgi:hypothetical protein
MGAVHRISLCSCLTPSVFLGRAMISIRKACALLLLREASLEDSSSSQSLSC